MSTPQPILPVIVGPTASGKSKLAVALAAWMGNAEVVSCDSVAVYRGFDIGTAKPSAPDRALVPHHMIDIVNAGEVFTAGDYSRLARAAIKKISEAGKIPIVVGGTGLYLRALLDGLFVGPPRSEELRARLRERAELRGTEYVHRILARMDSVVAASIHPNDLPKTIRAIEVCMAAQSRMSDMWQRGRDPIVGYRIVRIGLEPGRNFLYERINERCISMFQEGLVEEARSLWQQLTEFHNEPERERQSPFFSTGYRQSMQVIRGELTREQALSSTQQAHRNYAKRQLTWFHREKDIHWFNGFGNDPEIQMRIFQIFEQT
jgi:tRNA dimethylallyltransferase